MTPPGTLITLAASATCNGQTTEAVCYMVVVKQPEPHRFSYAPSAASIAKYKGTPVSFVFDGVRLVGILLLDGRVFKDGAVYTPEKW